VFSLTKTSTEKFKHILHKQFNSLYKTWHYYNGSSHYLGTSPSQHPLKPRGT